MLAMGGSGVGVQSALAAVYGLLVVLLGKECMRAVADSDEMPRGWGGGRIAAVWPGGTIGIGGVSGVGRAARERAVRHAVAGIASSVVMVGMSSAVLLASGASWDMLVFGPLRPGQAIAGMGVAQGWMLWAWWLYAMSVLACVMNVLPLRPLDGGVLLENLAGSRGWREGVVMVRWVVVGGVIAVAMVGDSARLVALVACCVWWMMRNEVRREELEIVEPVAVGPGVADEREVETINAWTRLRERGVDALTAREVALLDQVQAEMRDRLHPEDDDSRRSEWKDERRVREGRAGDE
jgi:hypothetical protein